MLKPSRRTILTAAAAATAATAGTLWGAGRQAMDRLPVGFLGHGAPPLLDDRVWMGELAAWAAAMPRPKAILMVSAHWEQAPVAIGATTPLPLVYDFFGFPQHFYEMTYPSPGAPEVAARVRTLLGGNTVDVPDRGLDHGAYIPLMAMYPQADVPVLQISMPSLDPAELFAMGQALAPLRDEGVLLFGSGFMTHNLRALGTREIPAWASEFDAWAADVSVRNDVDALIDFERTAPGARMAHPRTEHFVPLLIAAGAAQGDAASFPVTGFAWGPFSKRSVQFG